MSICVACEAVLCFTWQQEQWMLRVMEQGEIDALEPGERKSLDMALEMVSVSYLHCVLKGLSKAPRPVYRTTIDMAVDQGMLSARDFDFLITPDGCFGTPHEACLDHGIEVIVVEDNKTVLENRFPSQCTFVKNYLEAVGVLACRQSGINERYVRSGSLWADGPVRTSRSGQADTQSHPLDC